MIKYRLDAVHLGSNPIAGLQMARVKITQKVSASELKRNIAADGTTVSMADVSAVFEKTTDTVVNLCASGQAVEIPGLGTFSAAVRGTADELGGWVKEPEAYIKFRCNANLVKQFKALVELKQLPSEAVRPIITQLRNGTTHEVNKNITPGGILVVKGQNLKFNATRADEGVWLKPVDESGTAVKIAQLVDNTYSRLTCTVPIELTPGDSYTIEIRTRKGGKTLVILTHEIPLVVL